MVKKIISGGTAHQIPADWRQILSTSPRTLAAWEDITPLARNEWLCWIISVKKVATRSEHIRRAREQLTNGKRRPCCWAGCVHRFNKDSSYK